MKEITETWDEYDGFLMDSDDIFEKLKNALTPNTGGQSESQPKEERMKEPEKQFCKICEHQLVSIDATLPEIMVQIGGLYVGKERMTPGKYYHNRLWVENSSGEGCFIPLPKVEKLISEEFSKHF